MINHRQLSLALPLLLLRVLAGTKANPQTDATNNKLDKQQSMETTTPSVRAANASGFDFEEVVRTCNASFTVPLGKFRRKHIVHSVQIIYDIFGNISRVYSAIQWNRRIAEHNRQNRHGKCDWRTINKLSLTVACSASWNATWRTRAFCEIGNWILHWSGKLCGQPLETRYPSAKMKAVRLLSYCCRSARFLMYMILIVF